MDRRRTAALLVLLGSLAAEPATAQETAIARSLAATCANCHGPDGRSRGEVASLAGLPAAHILQAFAEFKAGARPATIMQQIAKGYTDEQVRVIAAYFAAQPAGR